MLALGCGFLAPAQAQAQGICDRSSNAQETLLGEIEGVDDCADVTAAHLAGITTGLTFDDETLVAGDLDGLSGVTELFLWDFVGTTVPAGLLDDMISLTKLEMRDEAEGEPGIRSLPAGLLDNNVALTRLELTDLPQLTALPARLLDNLTALELFFCTQNGVTTLPAGFFDNNTALRRVSFGNNALTMVPSGIFDGLTVLEEVNLAHNRLTTLPADIFNGLTALRDLRSLAAIN